MVLRLFQVRKKPSNEITTVASGLKGQFTLDWAQQK